jgi:hypothetical protein
VNTEVKKAHNLLWACSRAYGVAWGLRLNVVYRLFVSIIRPSILFGSPDVRRLREENTKQDTKTILRDSGRDTHYSYACYEGTHLPSST